MDEYATSPSYTSKWPKDMSELAEGPKTQFTIVGEKTISVNIR